MEFADITDIVVVEMDVIAYDGVTPDSKEVIRYDAGNPIFVTGVAEGWYRIEYRGQTAYISLDGTLSNVHTGEEASSDVDQGLEGEESLLEEEAEEGEIVEEPQFTFNAESSGNIGETNIFDISAMDAEFESYEETADTYVSEQEAYKSAARSNFIWIGIIVAVVIGVIIVTIINSNKGNKDKRSAVKIDPQTKKMSTKSDIEIVSLDEVEPEKKDFDYETKNGDDFDH